MNVTADELREYIETFHRTLADSVQKYLPPGHSSDLFHTSLLPARITGYVSTQFGVAIEYEGATKTSVDIVRGSARVEDLFIKMPATVRRHTRRNHVIIAAHGCGLSNFTLEGGYPFQLANETTSVTIVNMTFVVRSWKRVVKFAEVFGSRKASDWTIGKAESKAKDEVLAAMLQLTKARERKIDISRYIREFKDKSVLVLGDYHEAGLERLKKIADALVAHGYEPVLVKDIPDNPHQDISQKVVAIGAVCRFVVIEDSSPSGHLLEAQLCKQNDWITVLLRAGGIGASWMTAGASHASNVVKELSYEPASLTLAIAEAVQWAENKLEELQVKFDSTYPWRSNS